MLKFDVISIGAVVQDTFVRAPQVSLVPLASSESGQALALPLGAKLDVDLMQHEVGGGAANSSVCFSRLGLQAAVISRIGDDFAGRMIKEVLTKEKVEDKYVRSDDSLPTGQSVLVLSPDGNRTVLVKRGAAADFSRRDMDEALLQQTHWIYVSSIGGNLPVLRQIFAFSRLHDIKVAWNPGALELAHGMDDLAPMLAEADILLLNREEAAKLTAIPHGSVDDVLKALLVLVEEGMVVVTNGAEGAAAFDGTHVENIPGRDVPVVDATGAGDSFGSGFVAAHIHGLPMDKALSFAIRNAESVIGVIGAQPGLLYKKDMLHQGVIKGMTRTELVPEEV